MPESMPWRDKSPKPATGGVYYLSESFKVRSTNKRDGSVAFILEWPEGAVLEEFATAYEAWFHADFCEKLFDGSYDRVARDSARGAYIEHISQVDDADKITIPDQT